MPDPPRMAERLLRRLVPGRDGDIIAGDLREIYSARGGGRGWYWAQVLSCLAVRVSGCRRVIPDLRQDLHYALRTIRRCPGYAATAVLCLALGVGVNATVLSLLDGLFFRPLPLPEAERVVRVDRDGERPCSWQEAEDLRRAVQGVQLAAVLPQGTFIDVGRANEKRVMVELVSGNYAAVLRLQAALGRWTGPLDERPGSERAAVISDALWMRRFRRDPEAIGKTFRIENGWYRIVGVAPREFRGVSAPFAIDLWVPLATYPLYGATSPSGGPPADIIGRLAPGAGLAAAAAELNAADARWRREQARSGSGPAPLRIRFARGLAARNARRTAVPVSGVLLGISGTVLLIACVNVASLLLSRARVRKREMDIRRSLGAGRGRLARQALTEGIVLASIAAVVGVVLAVWANGALSAIAPAAVPSWNLYAVEMQMNWRVVAAAGGLALASALLFSLSPAIEFARRETMAAPKRQFDGYAVAQVALSLVLLVATGLLFRALQQAQRIDPGFAVDHRLFVRLFASEPEFTPETARSVYHRMLEEARAIPGVRNATLSFAMLGFMDSDCVSTAAASERRRVSLSVVEPNYFRMMRVPLVAGRNFGAAERPGAPLAVIVNQTMARRWWPGEVAIGKTITVGCGDVRAQAVVVGIARDSKYGSLDEQPRPFLYYDFDQAWWNGYFALLVETEGDPYSVAKPLLKLARSGGPNLRVFEMRSLEDELARSLWSVRWASRVLGAFGLLAAVLAAVGVYGVVAYTVARRTHEIGVRMALGARQQDVIWMVLGRGLRLAGAGIALGVGFSFPLMRLLRAYLYGVNPLDPSAFVAACLAWMALAMLASYAPARRAARVDPVVTLKYE